ncbi:MAG: manganese efflux pump MntP family protein [Elusimicrobiota bacterium]|jgi:putative Mn2+ efflux pump MntP
MGLLTVLSIAVGLSMDAFAVSITRGLSIKTLRPVHALKIAAFFGGFQVLMPVLGWLAGTRMRDLVSGIDHWVAFALLAFVGGKMMWEALPGHREEDESEGDPTATGVLFLLAVATSIDAFAVGLTFSFLRTSILLPVTVIGLVTFAFSYAGTYIGRRTGHLLEKKAEFLGGIILIGIGVKVLLEHLGA